MEILRHRVALLTRATKEQNGHIRTMRRGAEWGRFFADRLRGRGSPGAKTGKKWAGGWGTGVGGGGRSCKHNQAMTCITYNPTAALSGYLQFWGWGVVWAGGGGVNVLIKHYSVKLRDTLPSAQLSGPHVSDVTSTNSLNSLNKPQIHASSL